MDTCFAFSLYKCDIAEVPNLDHRRGVDKFVEREQEFPALQC